MSKPTHSTAIQTFISADLLLLLTDRYVKAANEYQSSTLQSVSEDIHVIRSALVEELGMSFPSPPTVAKEPSAQSKQTTASSVPSKKVAYKSKRKPKHKSKRIQQKTSRKMNRKRK